MAYEQKDNSGSLFKNDKEGGNPNWPDYKGSALINGKLMYLAAWIKEGKNGKFMSLSFSEPKETKPAEKKPDFDDDLPF